MKSKYAYFGPFLRIFFPPTLTDTFFYPASVLVLVWSPKCLGFSVGPPSVLVLVWGQHYTGFSIWGSDMDTWGLGKGPTGVWFAPHVSWF